MQMFLGIYFQADYISLGFLIKFVDHKSLFKTLFNGVASSGYDQVALS